MNFLTKVILPVLALGQTIGYGQTPYTNIASGVYNSGVMLYEGTTVQAVNYTVTSNASHTLKAAKTIPISSETTINSELRAYIDPTMLQIAHMNGNWVVDKWKKFELGIMIPQNYDQLIENFLDDNPSNNNGSINPYDPYQIYFRATFKRIGWEDVDNFVREGFYYRDISTSGTSYSESKSEYPFRIRFAPPMTGNWKVKIEMFINSNPTMEATCSFGVLPSGHKGLLQVGNYNHLKDDNGNDFFAIGQDFGPIQHLSPNGWETPGPVEYDAYRSKIVDLKNKGGNFVRIVMEPDQFYLEWEEAGVFGSDRPNRFESNNPENYKRQYRAYELDKVFETCENNDVYIQLCTELDQLFAVPPCPYNGSSCWGSSLFHPYGELVKNIYNGGNPVSANDWLKCFNPTYYPDIFTYHKRRLKYIIARYGYSANLGIIETCNEFSGLGQNATNSYTNDQTSRETVNDWALQVAGYLDYFYPKHIKTVSFPDHIWQNPELYTSNPTASANYELRSPHNYGKDKNVPKNRFEQCKDLKEGYSGYATEKPVLFGELGVTDGWEVDNCFDEEFHNGMWTTGMSGATGAGLYRYGYHRNELRDHLTAIKAFFDGIPFQTNDFTSYYNVEPDIGDKEIEAIYNVNQTGTKGFGWAHNFNHYWAGAHDYLQNTCQFYNPPPGCGCNMEVNSPAGTYYREINFFHFQVGQDYKLERWNCYGNGGWIETLDESSNIFGVVDHGITVDGEPGGAYDPDIAFKIYRPDANFRIASGDNSIVNHDKGNIELQPDTVLWNINHQPISAAIDTTIKYHYWNFGNGITSNEPNPIINYTEPGTYNVSYSTLNSFGDTVTYIQSIVLLGPEKTVIDNNVNQHELINVYPNPGSGLFNVRYDQESQIVLSTIIADQFGKILKQYQGGPETVNLNLLPAGIYHLIFQTESSIITKKLILVK